MYPKGSIKVVWLGQDPTQLSSQIFDPKSLEAAILLGEEKGEYMIMELVGSEKDDYVWKLLPYGQSENYLTGIRVNRFIKGIIPPELFRVLAKPVKPLSQATSYTISSSEIDSSFYKVGNQNFTSKEVAIQQFTRVADVFLIGPFLIYVATLKVLPTYIRVMLFILGVATIIYNGINYLKTVK